jgi:hypothetical protein
MSDATPERTTILAVGIEQYDYGAAMNLPGAAEHAVRLARWAHRKGVPASRIYLAVTWLDSPTEEHLPGAVCIPATRDAIDRSLHDALADGGDLLIVFWCGHGVLNQQRSRVLFTGNATENNKVNFPVDEIRGLLSSTLHKGDGFGQQLLLIDACANFVNEMSFEHGLEPTPLSKGHPREVSQFTLFAADQGQIAGYNQIKRQAAFSQTVLDWLESQTPASAFRRFAELREHVKAVFKQRADREEGRQSPVSLVVQPSGADEEWLLFGPLPASGAAQRSALRTGLSISQMRRITTMVLNCRVLNAPDARTQLMTALGADPTKMTHESSLVALVEHSIEEGIQPVLAALTELAQSHAELLDVHEVRCCWERQNWTVEPLKAFDLVTPQQVRDAYYRAVPAEGRADIRFLDHALEASAIHGHRGEPGAPLYRFVAMLECLTGDRVPDEWYELEADQLAGLRAYATAQLKQVRARVIVDLRNPDVPATVAVAATPWPKKVVSHLFREGIGWIREEIETTPTEAGARQAVQQIVDNQYGRGIANFSIGFLMTIPALTSRPEDWLLEQDYDEPAPLWSLHATTLHSAERLETRRRPYARWHERVAELHQRLLVEDPDAVWLEPDLQDDPTALRAAIGSAAATCLAFRFSPSLISSKQRFNPLLLAVIEGAPYVCWLEEEPPDWAAVTRYVDAILAEGKFQDTPLRAHQKRSAIGHNTEVPPVRLLWDDPSLLPPGLFPNTPHTLMSVTVPPERQPEG